MTPHDDRARLRALAALGDGWHDGAGRAVTATAIALAERLLFARSRPPVRAYFYPTDAGGVLIEFVQSGWDYAVEIGPSGIVDVYGIAADRAGESAAIDATITPIDGNRCDR